MMEAGNNPTPEGAAGTAAPDSRVIAKEIRALPRLLLASRSPRRREMLSSAGILHDAEHPGVEDSEMVPGQATPEGWVSALAYLKAWAGWWQARTQNRRPAWVLGADTACVDGGQLIGTPRDVSEAEAMIQSFIGRTHDVVTGVALLEPATGRRWIFADRARVTWGPLEHAQVEAYLASGQWQGKAGGYNLRERQDAGWPITCAGDPTTVMGLPMRALTARLRALGVLELTGETSVATELKPDSDTRAGGGG